MVRIEVNQSSGKKISPRQIQQWVTHITTTLRFTKSLELSLGIVGDATMKKLNRTYRGKNQVTDVLSFADQAGDDSIAKHDGLLGEIVICYPQAVRQARRVEHSTTVEVRLLLTHGFLHLLGYDHERSPKDAAQMRRLEEKILGKSMIE